VLNPAISTFVPTFAAFPIQFTELAIPDPVAWIRQERMSQAMKARVVWWAWRPRMRGADWVGEEEGGDDDVDHPADEEVVLCCDEGGDGDYEGWGGGVGSLLSPLVSIVYLHHPQLLYRTSTISMEKGPRTYNLGNVLRRHRSSDISPSLKTAPNQHTQEEPAAVLEDGRGHEVEDCDDGGEGGRGGILPDAVVVGGGGVGHCGVVVCLLGVELNRS
jgi:hypothetical protein